jgi:hypothetical protein
VPPELADQEVILITQIVGPGSCEIPKFAAILPSKEGSIKGKPVSIKGDLNELLNNIDDVDDNEAAYETLSGPREIKAA